MFIVQSFKNFYLYLKRKIEEKVALDLAAKATLDVAVKQYREVHVRLRNGKIAILTKYKHGRVFGTIMKRDFYPKGKKWKWLVTGESHSFNPDYDIVKVIALKEKR